MTSEPRSDAFGDITTPPPPEPSTTIVDGTTDDDADDTARRDGPGAGAETTGGRAGGSQDTAARAESSDNTGDAPSVRGDARTGAASQARRLTAVAGRHRASHRRTQHRRAAETAGRTHLPTPMAMTAPANPVAAVEAPASPRPSRPRHWIRPPTTAGPWRLGRMRTRHSRRPPRRPDEPPRPA